MSGWIGVDLDGTLAEYGSEPWDGISIGPPVPKMAARVKQWLEKGIDVRIMTARVNPFGPGKHVGEQEYAIYTWCLEHIGKVLPTTCMKDYQMIELWDDRAIQVIKNTGELVVDQAYDDGFAHSRMGI